MHQLSGKDAITIGLQNFNDILQGSNDFVMIVSCKTIFVMVYYRSKIAFVQGVLCLFDTVTASDHTLGGKP